MHSVCCSSSPQRQTRASHKLSRREGHRGAGFLTLEQSPTVLSFYLPRSESLLGETCPREAPKVEDWGY